MRTHLIAIVRRVALAAALLATAACTSIHHVALNSVADPGKIVGVTTRSGRTIPFNSVGASITLDTLYGIGSKGQVLIPTDSVKDVWVRKFSLGRTVGFTVLLTGMLIGTAAATSSPSGPMFKQPIY